MTEEEEERESLDPILIGLSIMPIASLGIVLMLDTLEFQRIRARPVSIVNTRPDLIRPEIEPRLIESELVLLIPLGLIEAVRRGSSSNGSSILNNLYLRFAIESKDAPPTAFYFRTFCPDSAATSSATPTATTTPTTPVTPTTSSLPFIGVDILTYETISDDREGYRYRAYVDIPFSYFRTCILSLR